MCVNAPSNIIIMSFYIKLFGINTPENRELASNRFYFWKIGTISFRNQFFVYFLLTLEQFNRPIGSSPSLKHPPAWHVYPVGQGFRNKLKKTLCYELMVWE